MTRLQLYEQITLKGSYLCIGLDTDITKIPKHLLKYEDPVFEFNRQIIDATKEYCVAYKPNLAFYESRGPQGLESLERTVRYIPTEQFTIADAKRGDIGNTAEMYAQTFYDFYRFDAVTVAPYMGHDSVIPFIRSGNWVILLALTSNEGSKDFQLSGIQGQSGQSDEKLFEQVLRKARAWAGPDEMMFVVGATHPSMIEQIRRIVPDYFLLVPGVGAQGGSLSEVSKAGLNATCGLLVNSSRQIIYASQGEDFADRAREAAKKMQIEMKRQLETIIV
ncbi:MAG: orotidine-5'-phosphate decarboxylase [Bacteroidetes bacterium]|nr:MAG: orotidine-5'-phosphate decarboxylase [Bacteroidota bacterium]